MSDTTGVTESAASRSFFARQATGLVREIGWLDAAFYNIFNTATPVTLSFIFLFGPAFYLGSDLVLATVIAFVLAVPIAALFAMLGSAIPRSGGDYAWLSRIIHPAIGFASNLSTSFWYSFFVAVNATLLGSYAVSPFLRIVAGTTGSTELAGVADFVSSPLGIFVVAVVVVLLAAAITASSRIGTYMRIQRAAAITWIAAAWVLPSIVVWLTSRESFVSNFNSYVAALGGPEDAYSLILSRSGYVEVPFDLGQTVLAQTLPFYALGFIFLSVYLGGEVKRGKNSALLSMPGAAVIAAIGIVATILAYFSSIDKAFIASLGLVDPAEYGFAFTPNYLELAAIASDSVVVGAIGTLGFAVFALMVVPVLILMLSRNILAWSFDRLMPEALARVTDRTHSPLNAILLVVALSLLFVALLAFNPDLTGLVGLLGLIATYVLVAAAGIVFPYRRRDLFESSPFNGRIAGTPTITLVAVLALATSLAIVAILLTDPNSGTSLGSNPERVLFAAAVFLVGIPIYYAIRAIRKSQGIDVDLAYREIPPE